jgi:diguanylate cyclase (GGDEF)-like protein
MAIKQAGQLLDEQSLVQLEHKGFYSLRFPEAIERKFQQFYIKAFSFQARISLFTGFLVFASFGYLDWHFQSENPTLASLSYLNLLMYYFPLPILLLLGIFSYFSKIKQYQQLFLVIMMLTTGFALIVLVSRTPNDANDYYFMGLLILEMLCFTSARMRFWSAVFCVLLLFIFYNVYYGFFYVLPKNQILLLNFFYTSGSILSLLACYFIEYAIRKDYIHYHLLESQSFKLNQAILQLENFANIDGLTQIPNRRSFDKALTNEWNRCKRLGLPLTLFMMDIDVFKKYNDFYGHIQGDECLKKIALIIKNHARRVGDLAARFGGEEFALILPNTKREDALLVAKSILEELRTEAIKHQAAPNRDRVTLSIGIVTAYPNEFPDRVSFEDFIHQADERLYECKNKGGDAYLSSIYQSPPQEQKQEKEL